MGVVPVQAAVDECYEAGYLGKNILGSGYDLDIFLHRGAAAYICGEESAMIESIEGKRGLPRHRPPYVAEVGIFGRPTLVQNVETLYWVRDILERGPNWFSGEGRNGRNGRRQWRVGLEWYGGRRRLPLRAGRLGQRTGLASGPSGRRGGVTVRD